MSIIRQFSHCFEALRHRAKAWPAGLTLALLTLAPVLNSGCRGRQSALDAAGIQAARFGTLWWIFFGTAAAVFLAVLVFLIWAVVRALKEKSPNNEIPPVLPLNPQTERRLRVIVGSLVGLTVAILFALLVTDFFTGKAIASLGQASGPLTITITGHRWWWEVEYNAPIPSNIVMTANEIHLPIGRPVQFQLRSADVIHSFWPPNLHGKKDLIPGHPTTMWVRADRPGTFRGQCAEFCGAQHAHMRFVIMAEKPDRFAQWLNAQQQPAAEPATDEQKRGKEVFLSSTCVMCHTIQGTIAGGRVGPNLTHVASRKMLAAGTLPNSIGHLAGWILDPQEIKPGAQMPQNNFAPKDLRALLEYLETLK